MSQSVEGSKSNPSGGCDYKAKLDEAAARVKSPPQQEPTQQGTDMIDKVTQYIPAVGNMLGSQQKEPEREQSPVNKNPPGPPHRPAHDTQIEEFIKDQHHSTQLVGIDEPKQNS